MKAFVLKGFFIYMLTVIAHQANLLRSIYCPANAGNGTSYG